MEWDNTFTFKGKKLFYNHIVYNNPSERSVEVSIAFDFFAQGQGKARMLEVGNVLANYENSLSEYFNLRSRRIVDKFEDDIGVDKVDLMDIPSEDKYDLIASVSTVEHIGQGSEPSGSYGETDVVERDLEAPLKAITKIYELLSYQGKALVTVPFGKLTDAGWYVQFSPRYLRLLVEKYKIPQADLSAIFFKKINMQMNCYNPYQTWIETEEVEVAEVEYNWPFPCANAIAVLELTKQQKNYNLLLDFPTTDLEYFPVIEQRGNGKSKVSVLIRQEGTSAVAQLAPEPSEPDMDRAIIALDGVFFQLYATGIARVWKSLMEEWSVNGFSKCLVVLDRDGTSPKIPGFRYRTIPPYNYADTETDRAMLQQVCDEEGVDIFISTYYTTPITTPSVFMAYDMIPEILGADFNEPMWREKHYGISHASRYLSISENTAQDLVKCFPAIPPEQVTVAYCGVSYSFSPASPQEIAQFKAKYGITKPYFILVGAGSNYKNPGLFFQAFGQLPSHQGFEVICTGSGYLLADEYRQFTSGTVVHSLKISDEELRLAYSGATALVYPSRYEGFGLPIVEAMACGCPVITCPNASIPEVAGDAAIYVNDTDVAAMADALCEVQKPEVCHSLTTTGFEQVKKFSWSNMAEKVSGALIDTTLLSLNLQEMNLIVFPDWSRDESSLSQALQAVIREVATHSNKEKMALLITYSGVSDEAANLILSSAAMNLLMEAELDVSEGPAISLVGQLSQLQWQALIPKLEGKIDLEYEDEDLIKALPVNELSSVTLDKLDT
ncbi:MAG: glycosyltransferase family 4 protein [Microcoleaceae cyanobacterium]